MLTRISLLAARHFCKMELDALEQKLDKIYSERRDYVVSARQHQVRLLSLEPTEATHEQYIRLCRKLTL